MTKAPEIIWFDPEPSTRLADEFNDRPEEIPYIRLDIVLNLNETLHQARNAFTFYQGHYEAKGHSDMAQFNMQLAKRIDKVIKSLEEFV